MYNNYEETLFKMRSSGENVPIIEKPWRRRMNSQK